MSDPPPAPQISPDGKFYWDGQQWVPMPQAVPGPSATGQVAAAKSRHGLRNGCIGVAALFALVAAIGFCGSNHQTTTSLSSTSPSAQASVATGPAVDHTVLVVTGTGYQTTQPFKVPSADWILGWTLTGDPQFADATFFIYSSSGRRVDSVDAKPGTDSATIHAGKDVFFMEILDANASYKLTVTAKYPGPDDVFSLPAMSPVTVVSGSGDKSSPTFHVTGSVWRITIQTGTPSQYTSVTAYVVKAGETSDTSEASVEGAQGGSTATSYVYAGPGDYYIKVLSANTAWTVTVEQTVK